MLGALSENEIQNLHAAIRQTNHQKALHDLHSLLDLEQNSNIVETIVKIPHLSPYIAKQSEKIFQNWIEKNLWALGIDYVKKHSARQISIDSESDLMMETTDGFIDLIELKRPKFELFARDPSHNCYFPSKELSKVLGQCMSYIGTLEDYKLNLQKKYKFKLIRPRIKIIIGRSNEFNDEQHEALRMLNASLNQMQIMTYDYLYSCGQNIVSYYNHQLEDVVSNSLSSELASMS